MSCFQEHSTDDLKTIVQNYQKGDSHAAEQLRQQFCPLIYKLSHRQSMYSTFGEDAENMAWLLFYEFMYEYKGEDFIRLPGLVKRFVIFRLLRLMEQQGTRWDNEEFLEDEALAGRNVTCEPLEKLFSDLVMEEILDYLPSKESRVIEEYYCKNKTYNQVACNLNCTVRSVRYYRELALNRLKDSFKI